MNVGSKTGGPTQHGHHEGRFWTEFPQIACVPRGDPLAQPSEYPVVKAAVVSAIAVVQQTGALSSTKEMAGGKPVAAENAMGVREIGLCRLRRAES